MIQLVYFAAIFISAFSLGNKIFDILKVKANFLETAVFSSAIGFGIFSFAALFLGLAGMLYKNIFLILIIAILLFSFKEIRFFANGLKLKIAQIKKLKIGINLILIIIFFMFVILNLIASLSPPYLWDEMTYNIALPKIYALHHSIMPVDYEFRSNYPFNINMLFAIGLVVGNASLSKLFMFGYGTLLAFAIFSFSRRYFSLRASLFAALAYYTMPMVSSHISSTYTDIGVAFYIFMGFYAFLICHNSGNKNWLFLSAAMTGLALASKHTAIYSLPSIFLLLAYSLYFKRKKNLFGTVSNIGLFFLIAFLIASPWYVKSYINTGNPFYPYGNSFFKINNLYSVKIDVDSNFLDSVGMRTFANFLPKFWDITMHSSSYGMLLGFGILFFAFVPLLVFAKKIHETIRILLFYSGAFFVMWYFGPQVIRYLMIYPMLAVASGAVIDSLLEIKNINYFVAVLLVSSLVFNLALWYGANSVRIPYAFGIESEQSFYNSLKDYNGYNVFKYANENLPKNSKLLLFREYRGYLSNFDYVVGDPLLQKVVDYSKFANSEDMHTELKRLGITHVFVNTRIQYAAIHNPNQPPRYTEEIISMMNESLRNHGKLLFEDDGIYLYKLN